MTQTETTTRADVDPLGELVDAERLLKAAYKLVEYLIEDHDTQDHVLGVLYAVGEKIYATSKMLEACSDPAKDKETRK
jgi:hypothetical protein